MFNKRITTLIVLLFALSLVKQVNSYTMAQVESASSITISPSDRALVALPKNLEIKIIKGIKEQQIGDELVYEPTTEIIENNLEITNNLGYTINSINIKCNDNNISFYNLNNCYISSGRIEKNIIKDVNHNITDGIVDITIAVEWNGGSATIKETLNIIVEGSHDIPETSDTENIPAEKPDNIESEPIDTAPESNKLENIEQEQENNKDNSEDVIEIKEEKIDEIEEVEEVDKIEIKNLEENKNNNIENTVENLSNEIDETNTDEIHEIVEDKLENNNNHDIKEDNEL